MAFFRHSFDISLAFIQIFDPIGNIVRISHTQKYLSWLTVKTCNIYFTHLK